VFACLVSPNGSARLHQDPLTISDLCSTIRQGDIMKALIPSKLIGVIILFCAAAAISSPAQTLRTLYSFCSQQNCADGQVPSAPAVQGNDGNFYGTTQWGGVVGPCNTGTAGCGTVFKMTPSGALTTLYRFCSQPDCADGALPYAGLIPTADGNFYGTTISGGTHAEGTVFKITPTGALTTLYSFCSQANCADGALPAAGLVQGSDGNIYGTTEGGGHGNINCNQSGCGTIFEMSLSGSLNTIYTFCSQPSCVDGIAPTAALIEGADGNFYGTTSEGGANGPIYGTVFKITPSGTLTTLYSFCAQRFCPDGLVPLAALVQATDGNFYGTTSDGGPNGVYCCGTVFKITPSGTLTTLYGFCSLLDCLDGQSPTGALLQSSDGNFYGTTASGGGAGRGTAFKITPGGVLTTLYSFCSLGSKQECIDGDVPTGLMEATNGNFYGTTGGGGVHDLGNGDGGTVFRLSGPTPTPVQFVPGTPCRLVDTRQGHPILGGTWRTFVIPQLGNCDIPTTATSYSLNVTVVPHGSLGYLTIWPTGEVQPYVSTMNSPDGRIKANAAIVPAGASGAVSVYVTDTTDVILDIDGYFEPATQNTYQFYSLAPCRIIDTRNGQDGGTLQAGMERDYTLAGNCGIPSSVAAYSLNVTVIPAPGGLDYLTVWPAGETRPVVSTLNDSTGTVVANAAIVPAGNEQMTAFYPNSNNADLLVDVNGYFAAPNNGYSLYRVAPCRAFDSRSNNGQPFTGQITVNIGGSPCAPPSNAAGYVFNATVVPSGSLGYLTLWPDPEQRPVVSTLNAYDGFITSNMAIVPNNDGSTDAYAGQGYTQLILDITGYFAP
jgi:uncharacterized repeat protein (TIGR03803 family)